MTALFGLAKLLHPMDDDVEEGEVVYEADDHSQCPISQLTAERNRQPVNQLRTAAPSAPELQGHCERLAVDASAPQRRPKKQKRRCNQLASVPVLPSTAEQALSGPRQSHYVDVYGKSVSMGFLMQHPSNRSLITVIAKTCEVTYRLAVSWHVAGGNSSQSSSWVCCCASYMLLYGACRLQQM